MDLIQEREPEINKLFRAAKKLGAAKLVVDAGVAPQINVQGRIRHIEMAPMSSDDLKELLKPILYVDQLERLNAGEDINFIYAFDEGDLYRVTVSKKQGKMRLSVRRMNQI